MSRREKQLRSLELLEREFREAFVVELERTARFDTIWCYVTREPLSYQTQAWFRARQQTHLLERVEEIEKLRHALGEPVAGTLCQQYRDFCRKIFDADDDNRLGPRRLAAQLLEEIRSQ